MVAKLQNTNVSFPGEGTIMTSPEGTKLWRVKIHLPETKGIGLYFDKFYLPEGVEMFLYNENRMQLKSTYSHLENNSNKTFATDPIQGSVMYLELNIQPHVKLDEIELNINQAAAYFGGLRELDLYDDMGYYSYT